MAVVTWLSTVGTNQYITGLILNNILLFWIITKLTKTKRDDTFFEALKQRMGLENNNNKVGEDKDENK